MRRDMVFNSIVRCGNLTAAARHVIESHTNPEFLAGLCGLTVVQQLSGRPAKGPAPLSTWGLPFLVLDFEVTRTHGDARSQVIAVVWEGVRFPYAGGSLPKRKVHYYRAGIESSRHLKIQFTSWPQWRERSIGRAVAASMRTTPVQQNDARFGTTNRSVRALVEGPEQDDMRVTRAFAWNPMNRPPCALGVGMTEEHPAWREDPEVRVTRLSYGEKEKYGVES